MLKCADCQSLRIRPFQGSGTLTLYCSAITTYFTSEHLIYALEMECTSHVQNKFITFIYLWTQSKEQ